LAGDFTEVGGFSARIAPAEQANGCGKTEAGLDKELAAVHPVDGIILQARVREEAVEEKGGGEIDAEIKRFPEMAA